MLILESELKDLKGKIGPSEEQSILKMKEIERKERLRLKLKRFWKVLLYLSKEKKKKNLKYMIMCARNLQLCKSMLIQGA